MSFPYTDGESQMAQTVTYNDLSRFPLSYVVLDRQGPLCKWKYITVLNPKKGEMWGPNNMSAIQMFIDVCNLIVYKGRTCDVSNPLTFKDCIVVHYYEHYALYRHDARQACIQAACRACRVDNDTLPKDRHDAALVRRLVIIGLRP